MSNLSSVRLSATLRGSATAFCLAPFFTQGFGELNPNLVGGDILGGAMNVRQLLFVLHVAVSHFAFRSLLMRSIYSPGRRSSWDVWISRG